VFGIAPGYADLNDHDELRHDPVMAVLAGKRSGQDGPGCAPLQGRPVDDARQLEPQATRDRQEAARKAPDREHCEPPLHGSRPFHEVKPPPNATACAAAHR
jgi:hypothetical protein